MKLEKTFAREQVPVSVGGSERVRSSGVLSSDEVAWCLANDIPLAYDPKQIGWVPLDCEDDIDTAPETASQPNCYVFRPWRDGDAITMASILSDKALWRYMPEQVDGPINAEAARDLIAVSRAAEHHFVRAVEWRGNVIGQVRLDFRTGQHGVAELSYWLGRTHWGKGHGGAMVSDFVRDCFDGRLDLTRLIAKVHEHNPASAKLLQRIGFRHEVQPGLEKPWQLYVLNRQGD